MLPVSDFFLSKSPYANKTRLLVLQHALRDTVEFLRLSIQHGFRVGTFVAKPNSKDKAAIDEIGSFGVHVIEKEYSVLEEAGFLDALLIAEIREARAEGRLLSIVDVGGYFMAPLNRLSAEDREVVRGVVEVTRFGHNRYVAGIAEFPISVLSIALSPLKEAEAVHVGETIADVVTDLLRERGLILQGKRFGIFSFGMIGGRIANAFSRRGHDVAVCDISESQQIACPPRKLSYGK